MKNKIFIVSGDPNSINSEIIFKSWKKINKSIRKKIFIISNIKLLKKQFQKLKYPTNILKESSTMVDHAENRINIINIDLKFYEPFKVSNFSASKFVLECLDKAHFLALKKDTIGIINCPINKKLLSGKNIGVTELLARKCKVRNNEEVMLIKGDKLSVSPITTHINIKDIPKKINSKIIRNKIKTINIWFKKQFKKKPKIAVLGLNPHNSELRKNSEESKIILPAILDLKKKGLDIKGPYVADTIFINEFRKFDLIVGMYHDQVLAPFKTLFKFEAINVTLGLKYLRVSPDHGTAIDLIGKNQADATSLVKCINFINKCR